MALGLARLRLHLRGRVQGVGFRPWLYRLADQRSLKGTITNNETGVLADLEGERDSLDSLLRALTEAPPPRAEIEGQRVEWLELAGAVTLEIVASEDRGGRGARIPADLATCARCREEICDPRDRRFQYPFTNCTECGPRFTIVESIPYDRERTSMRRFTLCPVCEAEYRNPSNRRYHAEPVACPDCGPTLRLVDAAGEPLDRDPMAGAAKLLRAGRVLAIKGLGGFHLAVDARNVTAVALLRERKDRELKPFAIMVRDLDEARRHVVVNSEEVEILSAPNAPIVLLRRLPASDLAPEVAPGNPYLGLMLPYTPLHHLLLEDLSALVMTSGNLSEEPIAIGNEEARSRLRGLADGFLEHDREILVACDDSVIAATDRGPLLLRRSRGFVPDPIRLTRDVGQVLAVGGQLKNSFCLTLGDEAYLGPHVGDLDSLESFQQLQRAIDHLQRLLRITPEAVVHDLHPDYVTTRFAEALGLPRFGVQHHHAHVAAVAIDRGLRGPVLGLSLDGTGYGLDGTIWGGELLLLPNLGRFERLGHLRPFVLPGGEACIRSPRRTAFAILLHWLGEGAADRAAPLLDLPVEEREAMRRMMARGVGLVTTSSCGRLFDAVAALCGRGRRVTYEGQPAMELEFLAVEGEGVPYPFAVASGGAESLILNPAPALLEIVEDRLAGASPLAVASRFHHGIAEGLAQLCARAANSSSVRQIVLSGGCFQNRILLPGVADRLEAMGMSPYTPRRVPPGDGGLALGQAAVFAALGGKE